MSCIYLGDKGACTMFDEGHMNSPQGCDKDGECRVFDDPDPSYGCDTYEGISVCADCGADENIDGEGCTCSLCPP